MRGLTIIVAEVSAARFRTALNLALATAALGGMVRVFLDGEAVAIARGPGRRERDDAYVDAGLPTLATLLTEALDAGVRLILCQSGLALTGATPADFDVRAEFGGMVSLLTELGGDRLVIA